LYPQLSARENLIFAGRLHGLRDAASRADALLAEEALAAAADRPAGGFSRGMAQRLALARARMHEPSVLLLDEPFTGLDRRASAALALRIRALRGEGRALLLVTHDLAQAAELADAALVLARGQCAARLARPELSASALEAAYAAAAENAA
jgi:ABC-type multidrug transport system ATPase subunit